MLRLSTALSLALVLSSALAGATARAQETERDPEAHGLFLAGEAAYEAGRFEDALRYFQQSYELSPRPALLFNIGQAADRARLDSIALDAFRRFLSASPELDATSRRTVELRVAALEAALARGEHAAPVEETTVVETTPIAETTVESTSTESAETVPIEPPPSAPPSGGGPDGAGLALVITGGAVAVAGGILIGVGTPDTGALADPRVGETYPEAQSRQDTGTALVVSGLASAGVGAVLLVVGAAILAASPGASEHARIGPNGLEVSF
jgi:tetratricopeptide (TPR) repeat protein